MIARLANTRRSVTSAARRTRQNYLGLARAQCTYRMLRYSAQKGASFPPKCTVRRSPSPSNVRPVSSACQLRIPRALPRPVLAEVDLAPIEAAYPELAGVPAQYIRDKLPVASKHMLTASANVVQTSPSTNTLPTELEIFVNDMVAAACPTHMLAVYSNRPSNEICQVKLSPTHQIVLAAHCANLRFPSPPRTQPTPLPNSTSSTTTLPVLPLRLPSAETFPILHSFLYTHDTDALLKSLIPRDLSLPMAALHSATLIHGVWQNACGLGVVEERLWDTIEGAWEVVIRAMEGTTMTTSR